MTVAYTYDLLVALCDSPAGNQALRSDAVPAHAV